MASFGSIPFDAHEFGGIARLFPLSNVVVFPHAIQPLHIFEPRYRVMLEDALATDRLIAVALLRADASNNSIGLPETESIVCLGKVITVVRLPDGRSNILLGGVHRAEIVEELETGRAFRQARVELVTDLYPRATQQIARLKNELVGALKRWLPSSLRENDQIRNVFDDEMSMGAVTDVIANCLPIGCEIKQLLLDETDVVQRGLLLLDSIAALDELDESVIGDVNYLLAGYDTPELCFDDDFDDDDFEDDDLEGWGFGEGAIGDAEFGDGSDAVGDDVDRSKNQIDYIFPPRFSEN